MSLLSSFMGSGLVMLPSKPTLKLYGGGVSAPPPSSSSAVPMVIECSSRPQKKGTAHHRKTRPKKTAPWDVRRKPTVYAPLPKLPPEWSFATTATTTETSDSVVAVAVAAEVPSSSSSETSDSVVGAAEVPSSSSDNNNDDA